MAKTLGEIRWLNKNLTEFPFSSVKILNMIAFGSEGDRRSRRRLKEWEGFPDDEDIENYREIFNKFSEDDLQKVCILLGNNELESKESMCKYIFSSLQDIDRLCKRTPMISDEESDNEMFEEVQSDAAEGGSSKQLKRTSMESDVMNMLIAQNEKLIEALSFKNQREFCVMPDLHKNVKEFNGKEPKHEAKGWLRSINYLADVHHWPDALKLEVARGSLIGAAKNWFLSKEIKKWSEFENKFTRTYVGEGGSADMWRQLLVRVQGKEEDTEDYLQEKLRMCKELLLSFDETKLQVVEGLWSKDLCDHLLSMSHNNDDELRDSINTFERINQTRLSRIRKSWSQVNNPRYATNGNQAKSYQDFKRSSNTTIANETTKSSEDKQSTSPRERVITCYSCGVVGHISKECPKNLSTREGRKNWTTNQETKDYVRKGEVNVLNYRVHQNCIKYIKPVKINRENLVYGLIDSGASDCTIRDSVAKKFNLIRAPARKSLVGFGRDIESVIVKEVISAVLTVEDVVGVELDLLVVPDTAQMYDVIIGRNWLDQPHVAFCSINGMLKIGYREEDPFKNLQVDHQPTDEIIGVNEEVKVPPACIYLIEVVSGNETFSTWVRNDSEKELKLRKGDILDRGHILNLEEDTKSDKIIGLRRPILEPEVNIGIETNEDQRRALLKLLNHYRVCFATTTAEIGLTDKIEMNIQEEPGSRPIIAKPYKVSHKEREIIGDIVHEWRESGIVTDTKSPYASPVLLVKKKTGDYRLVVDYRRLNKQTVTQTYPIPNIDDQLELLTGANLFITLDLAHGYLQVPLSPQAKEKTAFITPDDHAQFERMVFGLKNAPFEFTRLMNKVLGNLRNRVVLCYLDDLLIAGKTWEEIMTKLESVLEALKDANLTLRLQKCHFGKTEIEYLGFVISSKGITPGPKKTEAIANYPVPRNAEDVRRFLGLAGFFRRFVPNFSCRAQPLITLMKKGTSFMWTEYEQEALDDLKTALTKEPILKIYNPNARTELHTDASAQGLAGMLLQEGEDGALHLVYCVSRRTSDTEKYYHSSKLELLAIIWSVQRLRQFLINIPFVIFTDCQALIYLNNNRSQNAQIYRWYHQLQEYNFEVKYRPGEKMRHVDALSRATEVQKLREEQETEEISEGTVYTFVSREEEVRLWQLTDERLRNLRRVAEKEEEETNNLDKLKLINGIMYKNVGGKDLLVVPNSIRKFLAVKMHDLMGHCGLERTITNIKKYYWFPGMRRYVKKHISMCIQCKLNKIPSGRKHGELHPIPPGGRPFAIVHIDHLGPFIRSNKGNNHLLVIIDNLSRFVKLYPVKNLTTKTTLKYIQHLIGERGIPEIIITDRGTAFTSHQFAEFCCNLGIKHNLISVRHPRANGMVERVNRTVLPMIRSLIEKDDGSDWDKKINECEKYLNLNVNRTTQKSPYELLYGYQPRFANFEDLGEFLPQEYEQPEIAQENARQKIQECQEIMKQTFDAKVCKAPSYYIGDIVFIRRGMCFTGEPSKTQPRYKGPMVVTAIRGGDSYSVSDLEEKDGRLFATSVHASDMKLWAPTADDNLVNEEGEEEEHAPEEEECGGLEEHAEAEMDDEEMSVKNESAPTRKTQRERRLPTYLRDYCQF